MKNLIFFLVIIGSDFCSYGQIFENEIVGHWRVGQIVKKSTQPELRGVMDGFKHATFNFLENGDFHLKTKSKAPAFQMILRITENSKWKFDSKAELIKIGTEEDGYSIMRIHPKIKNSTLQFALNESEMVFEMERIP